MDTLVVPLPRKRAYGLCCLATVLAVVTALSDPAGRLLAGPATVAVLALAVRDLRSGPVLRADAVALEVLQGVRRTRVVWAQVERMRVVRDRRAELLELDFGDTLALLSRQRLGRLPDEVLADLIAVRDSVNHPPDVNGTGSFSR